MNALAPWEGDGWRGRAVAGATDVDRWLAAAAAGSGRSSRHARTVRVGDAFVKSYPAPGGRRATHAHRIGERLGAAGFGVPEILLVARRGGEGLLVSRDVGGDDLLDAVAALRGPAARGTKRRLLSALGAEVARLHVAGFVHGDLVPPNVRVVPNGFVLIDHDRTRHGDLLVWFGGRRNLVQLGRFVVPGVTATDRMRVLVAYARGRGLSRRRRKRLAGWLAAKIVARRCRIDRIAEADAARAGFRELMRSGGPFDPARPTEAS